MRLVSANNCYLRGFPLKYAIIFITIFGVAFVLHSFNGYVTVILDDFTSNEMQDNNEIKDRFTINTEGCRIPFMHTVDESIKKFVGAPKKLKPCDNSTHAMLMSNRTHIWINKDGKNYSNSTDDTKLLCCYKPFYRPDMANVNSRQFDERVKYNKCIYFDEIVEVKDEFVRVVCKDYETRHLFQKFFAFAPKKDLNADIETKSGYNVIVMGIDGVSRLNLHRTMPKTVALLKSKDAVELLGYNKVGDNTFPNLIPMLLGLKEKDLRNTCLPNKMSSFDNCPFVWERYKDAGYYTALAEDSAWMGTFNYEKNGFLQSPTHYYMHTFISEAEKVVGNNKDFNSYLCLSDKYVYKILLDYIEDLVVTLNSSRLFGFFWEISMSHDHLNYPMAMDQDYEEFFRQLDSWNYLDDTVLFLVSDHGIRYGDIRFTKQGRLEERLPFVFVLLPTSFKRNYFEAYNNLKINSFRLTTPFDIHATLLDLVDTKILKNLEALDRQETSSSTGISLFRQIPKNRTCQSAGIEDHWCTCHNITKISRTSLKADEASSFLIQHLNNLVKPYPQCSSLRLKKILDFSEMLIGRERDNEVGWREFLMVFRTVPGNGVFEATVRYDHRKWNVIGTISRLNVYGHQSSCIHDYQLKLYCYCDNVTS